MISGDEITLVGKKYTTGTTETVNIVDSEEIDQSLFAKTPVDAMGFPTAFPSGSGARKAAARAHNKFHKVLGHQMASHTDARRFEEIYSTRLFLLVSAVFAAAVALSLPFLDTNRSTNSILIAGLSIAVASLTWAGLRLRTPSGYQRRHAIAFAVGTNIGNGAGLYFFGLYSAANVAITMTIFFFALTHRRSTAIVAYVSGAIGPILLWVLVFVGTINERGLLPMGDLTLLNQVVLLCLIQGAFLMTFIIARANRRARAHSVLELEMAVRQITHREALLQEAKRELNAALKIGGPGRFTDQELGSYRLGRLIGRGAVGEVYEARHLEKNQDAAVKLLNTRDIVDANQYRRFFREAKFTAAIDSPQIAKVYEVADPSSPVPFMAMELLRGHSLSSILHQKRRLSVAATLNLIDEIAAGIDVAHRAGIVHRDLKPHNIFSHTPNDPQDKDDAKTTWKILDFGVSCLVKSDGTLTQGQAVGTPAYMAPEQARGLPVDHRSDLFAMGVIAYRALTGTPAFSGHDVPQIMHNVVYTIPTRPSDAGLSRDFDAVFAIALAKDPADRFPSGRAFATALRQGSMGSLSDSLEQRAARLVEIHPWGSRIVSQGVGK